MARVCSQTAPRVRVSQQRLSRSRRRSRPCLQLFHGRTTGAHLRLLTPTGPCSPATRLQGRAEILTNQLLPCGVCGGECFSVRQPTIAPTAGHSRVTPRYDNPPATPRAQRHDRTTRPSVASTPYVAQVEHSGTHATAQAHTQRCVVRKRQANAPVVANGVAKCLAVLAGNAHPPPSGHCCPASARRTSKRCVVQSARSAYLTAAAPSPSAASAATVKPRSADTAGLRQYDPDTLSCRSAAAPKDCPARMTPP